MPDTKTIAYWATTGLFLLPIAGSGFADVTLAPDIQGAMDHLGYPMYFAQILGTWKLLAVVAVLAPGFARIKEWAYAGVFFAMTGAALSHLAVGDGIGGAGVPLVIGAFAMASYALRPASRTLAAPVLTPAAVPAK